MGPRRFLFRAFLATALLAVPATGRAADLLVFAAASTTNVLHDVNAAFAGRDGGAAATFASSGILARQIENGAPADLIISANRGWLDYLAKRGFLAGGSRIDLCRNRLALIAPADSPMRIAIAPGFALKAALHGGRLAIADPGHTPAGQYAKQALESLGVWRDIAPRTARGHNVREALALVERGEAPAGIVYATDAAISARVRIVGPFPDETHAPIVYQAAIVADRDSARARAYLEFLRSPAAAALFRKHGFAVD